MDEAITKLYSVVGVVLIMMVPLLCFCGIIAYIRIRIDKIEQLYQAIRETVNNEDNPDHNDLRTLITFRQFRKAQPEFKQAVLNKLKTYDIVPTTIEKTMSPAQLYKANNPLWMTGFGVETIRIISILEEKLGQDTVADDCIDEFMLDCKHGMKPINALEKQLRKQNSLERAYQSWIRRN